MFVRTFTLLILLSGAASAQTPQSGVQPAAPGAVVQPDGQPATPMQKGKTHAASPATFPPIPGGYQIVPFATPPTLGPGVLELAQLEGDFQEAVVKGGGKAFLTFFAEDAVILNNGQPAILGRGALARTADWDPAVYQLEWAVEGAQMGPSGDMGFTWGHYAGKTFAPGSPQKPLSTTTGRYITIWKKQKDGTWKVALDASAAAPA